jgi:hypothetical protein
MAAGCTVAALLCPGVLRGLSAGRQPVIVIDQAEFRPRMLAEAEEVAARIFRCAGVDLNWENRLATSKKAEFYFDNQIPAQRPLFVYLFLREGVKNTAARFGFATVNSDGGESASIFSGPILDLTHDFSQPATMTQILGHVMAHEIGHLLSIVNHSPTGIMRGRWDHTDYRRMAWEGLLFTEAESVAMRAALLRRSEISATSRAPFPEHIRLP